MNLVKKASRTLIIFVAIIIPFLLEAQNPKRANIWYFGDRAGLDFSQGHPIAITDGAMQAFEGTAAMCDENGNLLFYTNGGDLPYNGGIWNRNHQMMPNGDLSSTGGCSSSFQSSLILPHPKYKNLYYLFTTDCIENSSTGGLRYSVIDMTLDGGLGDVAVKDRPLTTPVDESLTAVQHANGEDYWVISHKIHTDTFYTYHLTPYGITGLVKSKIGPVTPDYAGEIKASVNGQKLVYAGLTFSALFDFDKSTGEITHYIDLGIPGYSASFSPNCELLYIANGVNKQLYQFRLYASDIPASAVQVGNTASTGFGGMQMGPDDRIYIARFVTSEYLGVIMNPNRRGTDCNYVDNGIYLAGKFGKGGLPNFANNTVGECIDYPEENVSTYDFDYAHLALHETQLSSSHIRVSWNNSKSLGSFRVLFRESGEKKWNEFSTENNSIEFDQLKAATQYDIKVIPETEQSSYQPINNHILDDLLEDSGNTSSKDNQISVTTLKDFEFDLYPNPATNSTTVSLDVGEDVTNIDIVITQANGKILEEFNYDNVIGVNNFNISTSDLTNGIYHVAVQTEDNYYVKKLIVMK